MLRLFAGAAVLALAGCGDGHGPQASSQVSPPEGYRELIAKKMRASIRDPESVRDIGISAPEVGYNGLVWGPWAWVCVRANAKNGFGGYTGPQTVAYGFQSGREQVWTNPDTVCRNPTFGPFPELERALKLPIGTTEPLSRTVVTSPSRRQESGWHTAGTYRIE